MAKRKLTESEKMRRDSSRSMEVYKRDDMIQKARHKLSVQEQRCVLYAISRIKPEDTAFTEYTFELKDFYTLCGIEDQSYTRLKQALKGLSDRSWWAEIDDKGTESVVRWFSTLRTNKRSGKVTVKFHEDMMPFLLNLARQEAFYTSYNIKYVLPMNSQYSPRLYELLKSYQKNQTRWFFETDDLKHHLNALNYKNFNDFKRFVLDPAVEEINKYTDITIAYDLERKGRKVTRVIFYMDEKTATELNVAEDEVKLELDGQLSIQEVLEDVRGSTEEAFVKQRAEAYRKERDFR